MKISWRGVHSDLHLQRYRRNIPPSSAFVNESVTTLLCRPFSAGISPPGEIPGRSEPPRSIFIHIQCAFRRHEKRIILVCGPVCPAGACAIWRSVLRGSAFSRHRGKKLPSSLRAAFGHLRGYDRMCFLCPVTELFTAPAPAPGSSSRCAPT